MLGAGGAGGAGGSGTGAGRKERGGGRDWGPDPAGAQVLGEPSRPLGLSRGICVWAPWRGEVDNVPDPWTGFCSGKTASLIPEGCAEPGGGAGRELGGQRVANIFVGLPLDGFLQSCLAGGQ